MTRYYVRVSFLIQYSLYKNIACFTGQVTPERAHFISCSEQKLQEKNDQMISGFQVFYMFYSNFSAQVSTFHVVLKGRSWTFVWGKRSQMLTFEMLQTLFESTFLVLYNTIYTSIPGRCRSHLLDLDVTSNSHIKFSQHDGKLAMKINFDTNCKFIYMQ